MPFYTGGPDVLPAVQAEGLAGQQTTIGQQAGEHIFGIYMVIGISLVLVMGVVLIIFLMAQAVKAKKEET